MQKIIPFLWFNDNAEQAANFYTSVFKKGAKETPAHYSEAGAEVSGRPKGSVMTVPFEIEGQSFIALNGGPQFKFTPAVSFIVNFETADEVQAAWDQLTPGGSVLMPLDKYPFSEKYGWVQDQFGVSWQLILVAGEVKQKIIPSLMFVGEVNGKAETAINLYTSIFKNAKSLSTFRYGAENGPDAGNIMFADFTLEDQVFAAMDSARAHNFKFNEAISFVVSCKDQEEIDYFWEKLSDGGTEQQCGWLKDQFGLSWQVVPSVLGKLMQTPGKSQKVMQEMLKMKKIDLHALESAAAG